MDTNIEVTETVASSTESDVSADTATPSATNECLVFDKEKGIDLAVDISANECLHVNTAVMAVVESEENVVETLVDNETQPVPIETTEVVASVSETITDIDVVDNFDMSLNPSSNVSDNITGKDNNMHKSNDNDVKLLDIEESNQKENGKVESTSIEQVENISNEETVPQNKEANLKNNIEPSIEDTESTLPSSDEKIVESNACDELNVEGLTEEINVNLLNAPDENIQRPTEELRPEIPLEGVEVMQEVVNTELDKLGTVEEQLQSIHNSDLLNENVNEIADQELSTTTQENEVVEQHEPSIENIEENPENFDGNNTNDVDLGGSDNPNVAVDDTPSINAGNLEIESLSSIENKQPAPVVLPKPEEEISIVEAISRDFDEIDSEDVDKPDTSEVAGVNIRDQLQHGTVTVTDTTGQVYYVQSVEDIIVVENDTPATLDQPDVIELTVLREVDDPEETQTKHATPKEKPPIPSHILGRNIENPVIDTFRNGKVPPKPRLGVKIPYKNLTSQIVSKDELAQEILERQRQKHKQLGQTTREMLFAKKLTQRLAKKIAPTEGSPNPVDEEVTVKRTAKDKDNTINNSDLLAILEGDGEDSELKKNQDADGISSADVNVSESGTSKTYSVLKESTLRKTEVDRKQKSPMSKMTEREIALRQLKELPVGSRRRRGKLITNNSLEITIIENELDIQSDVPSRNTLVLNDKEDLVKKLHPKISGNSNNNPKLIQSQANIEQKQIISSVPDKIEDKSATKEINDTDAIGIEQSDIRQANNNLDKDKQVTTKIDSEDSNTKASENRQTMDSESELIGSAKTKSDIKQKVCHALPTIEHVESHIKTKDVEQESQVIDVNEKLKSNEINPTINTKSGDKSKKIELLVKSPSAKTAECKIKDTLPKEEFVERKHIGNPPIKTYTRKRKSTEDISVVSNVPDKKIVVPQKLASIPPNTYVTKSSRIIKRKVIWDPDEPSTARSLVTRSPKADLLKLEKPVKPDVTIITVDKKPVMKTVMKPDVKSPTKSPDSQKIKKRLSEVDRLLMDEGAVNMLYAVKNVDDAIKKKKTNVISLDKAQKELINKTNELKKDLKTNSDKVSPKSLRRKDSPVPTPTKKMVPASVSRKKSKDSSRSSLHSPPSSPSMMFSNHAEASRIIRRHSSSSYSSMEGEFDDKKIDGDIVQTQTSTLTDQEKLSKKRIASGSTEGIKLKRVKRNVEKESVITAEDAKGNEEASKNFNKLIDIVELKYDKYKTFSVKQVDHMVQIILLPSFNNEAYLTPEILNELCGIMKELQEDTNCTVVVISSSASSFCHGINYKTLLNDKEQSRKAFARKLATCVTNFLRILATFPKILVAGVHGDTVGAGVTVLPLFDMVIASDTATFSIPNARLGCAAEGGSLLSLPHLMHNVLVSELLYASRKLIAAEALRLGMVTRVLWPDKFQQELVSIVKSISNQSSQFMVLTKKQLRQHMMEHIEEALTKEVDTLVEHWTSAECQKNFGVYG